MVLLTLCWHALFDFHVGFPAPCLVGRCWMLQCGVELVRLQPSWEVFWEPLCNAGFFVHAVSLWVEWFSPVNGCGAALPWAGLDIARMPSWVYGADVDPSPTFGTSSAALARAFWRTLHIELRLLASCGVFCGTYLRPVHLHVWTFPNLSPFLCVLPVVPHRLQSACLGFVIF